MKKSELQARTFLDPSDIFNGDTEPEETKDKVQKAVNVLKTFKETYEDHKAKLHSYFSGDQEPVEWEFTPKLVFPRFDKFTARLEMIIVSMKIENFFDAALFENKTISHVEKGSDENQ